MLVAAGIAVASLAFSGLRLVQTRMHLGDLTERVKLQRGTLANLRQTTAKKAAEGPSPNHGKKDAIARVQSYMERASRDTHCEIGEFQASLDRIPYLSAFTLDTNKPDWEQVQIHLTLNGPLQATLAAVDKLRKSGIPMEPDSIEITRATAAKNGMATVALRLVFRVLIHSGGAS